MKEKRKYVDRREYLIKAVTKRRRKIKQMAVDYKGGKCQICGYNRCLAALDLHHVDDNKKGFGISHRGHSRSWERVRVELNKCVLVCSNCHREIEIGITQPPRVIEEGKTR